MWALGMFEMLGLRAEWACLCADGRVQVAKTPLLVLRSRAFARLVTAPGQHAENKKEAFLLSCHIGLTPPPPVDYIHPLNFERLSVSLA